MQLYTQNSQDSCSQKLGKSKGRLFPRALRRHTPFPQFQTSGFYNSRDRLSVVLCHSVGGHLTQQPYGNWHRREILRSPWKPFHLMCLADRETEAQTCAHARELRTQSLNRGQEKWQLGVLRSFMHRSMLVHQTQWLFCPVGMKAESLLQHTLGEGTLGLSHKPSQSLSQLKPLPEQTEACGQSRFLCSHAVRGRCGIMYNVVMHLKVFHMKWGWYNHLDLALASLKLKYWIYPKNCGEPLELFKRFLMHQWAQPSKVTSSPLSQSCKKGVPASWC